MTLDSIVEMDRLPAADEFVALCDEIGIGFGVADDGRPALKVNDETRDIGLALAKLIRREPWRTQIIEAKKLADARNARDEAAGVDTTRVEVLCPSDGISLVKTAEFRPTTKIYNWRYVGETAWRYHPGPNDQTEGKQVGAA